VAVEPPKGNGGGPGAGGSSSTDNTGKTLLAMFGQAFAPNDANQYVSRLTPRHRPSADDYALRAAVMVAAASIPGWSTR
jgi:hypothetical protein